MGHLLLFVLEESLGLEACSRKEKHSHFAIKPVRGWVITAACSIIQKVLAYRQLHALLLRMNCLLSLVWLSFMHLLTFVVQVKFLVITVSILEEKISDSKLWSWKTMNLNDDDDDDEFDRVGSNPNCTGAMIMFWVCCKRLTLHWHNQHLNEWMNALHCTAKRELVFTSEWYQHMT
jgi:hypothetical protein